MSHIDQFDLLHGVPRLGAKLLVIVTLAALVLPAPPARAAQAHEYTNMALVRPHSSLYLITGASGSVRSMLAPTRSGSTFVVNTNADTDDGECNVAGQGSGNQDCTLKWFVRACNAFGCTKSAKFSFTR